MNDAGAVMGLAVTVDNDDDDDDKEDGEEGY